MSAKPQRQCWSCKQMFPRDDRHCPNCGADSWNPPQGPAGSQFKDVPVTYSTQSNMASASTITAAGVIILATLALLSVWFWAAIWVMGILNEPEPTTTLVGVEVVTFDDYITGGRVLIAVAVAAFLSALTWGGAMQLVSED